MRPLLRSAFVLALVLFGPGLRAGEPVRVFAAASLTDALKDIGARWEQAGHPAPTLAFGGSSALAVQAETGSGVTGIYLARIKEEARVPMIYVTHSRAELDYLADRVLTMEAGRFV